MSAWKDNKIQIWAVPRGEGEMYKFLIIENVLKCLKEVNLTSNLGKFEQVSKSFNWFKNKIPMGSLVAPGAK